MHKTNVDNLLSIIAAKEVQDSGRKKPNGNIKQNTKTYSSVVLEGDKLAEAIKKANEFDEFKYILDALKPTRHN